MSLKPKKPRKEKGVIVRSNGWHGDVDIKEPEGVCEGMEVRE